jgi:endonuclease/exonuclease/phosphatase family metal-dependent hydrolase
MQDANSYAWDPRAAKSWNAPVFGLPYVYEFGQYVVASRFELRDCGTGHLDYPGESQRYVHCVVATPDGPVSLVTAHFESPRSGFNAARHEGLEGVVEWRRNYADRYLQSTELARDLVPIARPLIVAGDLNAPESSSVVRTLLAVGLRDAFSAAGVGYGYSYGQALKLGFSFLRIDHILVSPEIGVVECHAGGGEASDHRPVIAELQLPH